MTEQTSSEPRTYYARDHKNWGNSIQVLDWKAGKLVGWLARAPRVGDRIIFDMKSGRETATIVTKVDQQIDPPDMFFAEIRPDVAS